MAVRSRDFVGIAEGIRSHELSTRNFIENLKIRISELSSRKRSLKGIISYLEAAIEAAYEDTDEDGCPDYGLIASLESEKSSVQSELSEVQDDLDTTGNELNNRQEELTKVEEEKAQTLFEVQERARKTSQNISLAGGMYGAYAGVSNTLQNSLQTSFTALAQAADILGGSVSGLSGGYTGGNSQSTGNGISQGTMDSTGMQNSGMGAFATFAGSYAGVTSALQASQFSTNQAGISTPATMPNYHSGQGTLNTKAIQKFSSEQKANEYAIGSFGDMAESEPVLQNINTYKSTQISQNMESQFGSMTPPLILDETKQSPPRNHTFSDWINPNNYVDGHYIGEGQTWGYKPYGNDTSIFQTTIATNAQQELNSYMQKYNYGKSDFAVYSKDVEWRRLYEAANLPKDLKETFLEGQYRTIIAKDDIKLYRVYGGVAKKEGIFLTSQIPTDRLDVKMGLALKAEWKNSREYFSEVIVPKGTIMHIGKAAPQFTASGHVLPGGMEQIVISREFLNRNLDIFGKKKKLGFKTNYKEFEKKSKKIERQVVTENRRKEKIKVVKKLLKKADFQKAIAIMDIAMNLMGAVQDAREMPNSNQDFLINTVVERKEESYEEKNISDIMENMGYEMNAVRRQAVNNVNIEKKSEIPKKNIRFTESTKNEVKKEKEKYREKDIMIDVGQSIHNMGTDEDAALKDPLEKADEIKEEIEVSILAKNHLATSSI